MRHNIPLKNLNNFVIIEALLYRLSASYHPTTNNETK